MKAIDPRPTWTPIPDGAWRPQGLEARKEALSHQVEEFAAILYSQMFREMREAADTEEGQGLFGEGTELFGSFFDMEVGRTFAKTGGGALKDALSRQLERSLDAPAKGEGGPQ